MTNKNLNDHKSLNNEEAWERLFDKYHILRWIDTKGFFTISASQIREFREARLMAKFDHSVNLPKLFSSHNLAILPITRGNYMISRFDAYHKFEEDNAPITRLSLPSHIQSLDSSRKRVFQCDISDFILVPFVHSVFHRIIFAIFTECALYIRDTKNQLSRRVHVENSQIEIDAAYEGISCLALLEAKMDISEDFLIRQLYYPFRVWGNRITKPVRPIFLVYSNGIYRMYEYAFENPEHYNSLILIKQKNYSIEDTSISLSDIQFILDNVTIISEPEIPFPQADKFERVINLCEMIDTREMSRAEVTENYDFDVRQTNYYTDAARYLGLLEKKPTESAVFYRISETGRRVLHFGYKQRQLEFCRLILAHKVFYQSLKLYFQTGMMPPTDTIVKIMKQSGLYHIKSDDTFERRSSTVKGWLNWIVSLIDE